MKIFAIYCAFALCLCLTACDPQSGITKKSMEKYSTPTPTPTRTPEPVEPINPADVVQVDVATEGPTISVNGDSDKASVNCNKYNRVMINGDGLEIKTKGICKQVMINGDKNQVAIAAASEIVINGSDNTVEYSKYVNGKIPVITDTSKENIVSKSAAADAK